MKADGSVAERFWKQVDRGGPDDCWPWTAATRKGGYGSLRVDGKKQSAHRVAWELECCPIPKGLVVLHSCDNPSCVNPDHLLLGTQRANLRDRNRKGRNIVPVRRGGEWTGKMRQA